MPDQELDDGTVIIDWADAERVEALLQELRGPGAQYGMSGDTLDRIIWTIQALLREVRNQASVRE